MKSEMTSEIRKITKFGNHVYMLQKTDLDIPKFVSENIDKFRSEKFTDEEIEKEMNLLDLNEDLLLGVDRVVFKRHRVVFVGKIYSISKREKIQAEIIVEWCWLYEKLISARKAYMYIAKAFYWKDIIPKFWDLEWDTWSLKL